MVVIINCFSFQKQICSMHHFGSCLNIHLFSVLCFGIMFKICKPSSYWNRFSINWCIVLFRWNNGCCLEILLYFNNMEKHWIRWKKKFPKFFWDKSEYGIGKTCKHTDANMTGLGWFESVFPTWSVGGFVSDHRL